MAQSSCEAELVAATEATKMGMFPRKVLAEIIFLAEGGDNRNLSDTKLPEQPVNVFTDGQAMICAVKNGDFSGKLKRIKTHCYYMADELEAGKIRMERANSMRSPQ